MLKSRSSSSSSDKIFDGVRFVLFGFDSVSESQYRSELVRRGGIDVGRYDDGCTHVIVSGRVYDDPVCVSARKDGKTLVTELWIDDSVDFGTLADASRVLYRPVKDLNGIPGSESLYICLTGYQRPERDDIMKMVSLMGAKFSKPLIANQVTHLICYKFEGEKYELAKKVKIKLVNHRWLEDCLKAWDILLIDNYTKSGWELEVLEAEARDSEEETEDVGMELMGQRSTGGAPCVQGQMSVPASSHVHTPNKRSLSIHQEGSIANRSHSVSARSHEHTPNRGSVSIQQEGSTANLPHSAENLPADRWFSTPYKETSFEEALSKQNLKSNVEIDHQEAGSVARRSANNAIKDGELTVPVDVNLQKRDNITLSDVLTTKIGSVSSRQERSNTLCYSKETPKKEVAREKPSDSCRTELNENILNGELDISPLEGRSKLDHFQFPTADCVLPQKRKVSDFSSGLKSSELEVRDPKISPKSPTITRFERGKPTSATSINYGHADARSTLEGAAKTNSEVYQHGVTLKLTSLSYNKRSLKRRQPTSESKFSRNADSPSTGSTQNCQQGEALDQPSGIKVKLAVETKELCPPISPSEDMVLEDMVPSFKPKNTMEVDASFGNASFGNVVSGVNNLVFAGRNNDVKPIKEMASETSGGPRQSQEIDKSENGADIVMQDKSTFISNETGVPLGRQHGGGAASPNSRETRKLSSTASTGTCKENVNEESKIVRGKKVVSRRNLSCKLQLTTVNTIKGKDSSTLDKATTPRKVESKPGKAAKSNSDIELGMEANSDNKEATKSFSKDVVMEDQTKPKRDPLDQMEASMDLEKENKPKENVTLASNVNAHANGEVPCENGKKSRQGTRRVGAKNCKKKLVGQMEAAMDPEKENKSKENGTLASNVNSHANGKVPCEDRNNSRQGTRRVGAKTNTDQTISCTRTVNPEPVWFILSGHRFQRKEFQAVIRRLRGKVCRDSHNWSYNATHFIVPEPVRRTEKFFAAAAAGRWILKMDYLTASNEAGKFVDEEPFEWYSNDLTEHGAISLEAPRKWRKLREKTGHGAFHGMRVIIYGDCISPTLDTLKRVVKAGDGTILATSPPYTRFLKSNLDFAIVSPGMPKVDSWVQEFLRHEIPCVAADYLVEYICKPGYPLKMHVLYNTHSWAEKSYANLLKRSEEIITDNCSPSDDGVDDISCSVCGLNDRGEAMLICGDEDGSVGCGIGTHIDCCNPPLEAVPEGDWFCTRCRKDREPKIPLRNKKSSSKCK